MQLLLDKLGGRLKLYTAGLHGLPVAGNHATLGCMHGRQQSLYGPGNHHADEMCCYIQYAAGNRLYVTVTDNCCWCCCCCRCHLCLSPEKGPQTASSNDTCITGYSRICLTPQARFWPPWPVPSLLCSAQAAVPTREDHPAHAALKTGCWTSVTTRPNY